MLHVPRHSEASGIQDSSDDLPFSQWYVSYQLCVKIAFPAKFLCHSSGKLLVDSIALSSPCGFPGCLSKANCVHRSQGRFVPFPSYPQETEIPKEDGLVPWLFLHFLAGPIWIFLACLFNFSFILSTNIYWAPMMVNCMCQLDRVTGCPDI